MACIDYGAVVKKNGKVLPYTKDEMGFVHSFNNYSTLSGGTLNEEYEDVFDNVLGISYKVCTKHEYIGDESVREFVNTCMPYDLKSTNSVIHNYMCVIGDKDYLVATYKIGLVVFDNTKYLCDYVIGQEDDYDGYHVKHKLVKELETPFGTIKIRRLYPQQCAIASFWYKEDYYEILFGYGVDRKEFIFSKGAKSYFDNKVLRKVRKWFNG